MPADMARAVRLYHTPSQMKQALKDSWVQSVQRSAAAVSGGDHSFQVSEEPEIVSDSSLARRRSAVARAILDEANSGKSCINTLITLCHYMLSCYVHYPIAYVVSHRKLLRNWCIKWSFIFTRKFTIRLLLCNVY